MYKLLTVDFWDTLIRRTCHPDSSKIASAYRMELVYHNLLREEYRDHLKIFHERCLIEAELVGKRLLEQMDGEYSVTEVLKILFERVITTNEEHTESLVAELAQYEFDFELRHTYPDRGIASFVEKYPAERRCFLSDFYMPSSQLERILAYHGIQSLVDGGICSCDVGLNKRSGRLFRHVHDLFGVEPKQHVHVGDSVLADILPAKRLGMKAVHFEPAYEHTLTKNKLKQFSNRYALFQKIAKEIDEKLEVGDNDLIDKHKTAFQLGVNAAPLFVGFMLHVAEQALKLGLPRLYFFTREGEFFIQVWKALFQNGCVYGIRLPLVDTLEVSRISTFLPSLREVGVSEMRRVWNLYSTQSLSALLKTLNLNPEEYVQLTTQYGLNLTEPISSPWLDSRVRELFLDEEFSRKIRASIEGHRANLFGYLGYKGFRADLKEVGIVDVGWRGTIQDNLAILHPNLMIHGFYLGLQEFLNEQPSNCVKYAFGPNGNSSKEDLSLLNAVSVVEMLCNSPNGSVLGWEFGRNGEYIAKKLLDADENKVFEEFTQFFQSGVLAASRLWGESIERYVISSGELRPSAIVIWRGLLAKPDSSVVEAHTSLSHNEIFGLGGFVNKAAVPSISDLFIGVFSRRVRERVVFFVKQSQWAAGVWGRRDISPMHRAFLVIVLHMALIYKRTRILFRV